jgi:predicted ArsR family transcriptional regulator
MIAVSDAGAIDPRTHRALAGASRVRILEFLRARGSAATAPEVAAQVGLHANTVRLHLDQLTDAGLVSRERESRTGPGRPRLLFSASPPHQAPPAPPDEGYQVLADILAAHLEETSPHAAEDAAEAGRAWARTMHLPPGTEPVSAEQATTQLAEVLDELGFAPAVTEAGSTIELRRCPFHQIAEAHSRVVCGVHLGLMQGALDELAAPVQAARLEPFVAPGLCLAHLTPLVPARGSAHSSPTVPPTEGP